MYSARQLARLPCPRAAKTHTLWVGEGGEYCISLQHPPHSISPKHRYVVVSQYAFLSKSSSDDDKRSTLCSFLLLLRCKFKRKDRSFPTDLKIMKCFCLGDDDGSPPHINPPASQPPPYLHSPSKPNKGGESSSSRAVWINRCTFNSFHPR